VENVVLAFGIILGALPSSLVSNPNSDGCRFAIFVWPNNLGSHKSALASSWQRRSSSSATNNDSGTNNNTASNNDTRNNGGIWESSSTASQPTADPCNNHLHHSCSPNLMIISMDVRWRK
jgi:hypothetical protein